MAARTTLALPDGESSPVTHTFIPNGVGANQESRWRNFNSSSPGASEVITMAMTDSPASPADYGVPGKRVQPRVVDIRVRTFATYTDSTTSLVLPDYPLSCRILFECHPRATEQQVENLRMLVVNMLNSAEDNNQMVYAIDKGEHLYGG